MKRKLQVFVSSTYLDLREDRQAAVSAILKAGHIPAGMELFTSGDQSQMTIIKRWIDDSDVYMLILGGRYGSIEPTSGVSYTELEYDYAKEQGKSIFSVVINDGALEKRVKKHGSDRMEKDNQSQLKMFKDKVLSSMSSFFEDEKDIRLCVHESLSDFAQNRDLKGWVSADEIPNTQTLFDEITKLTEENKILIEKLSKAEIKINSAVNLNQEEDFEELSRLLKSMDIKIPKEALDDSKDITRNLLDLFLIIKDNLITDVSNQHGISKMDAFIYYNICPKLQIYGLAENQKVAGVQWKRFEITKKGIDFAAFLEKKAIEMTNQIKSKKKAEVTKLDKE